MSCGEKICIKNYHAKSRHNLNLEIQENLLNMLISSQPGNSRSLKINRYLLIGVSQSGISLNKSPKCNGG